MTLLEMSGVTAAYGPVQALFGVDLALAEGEVVALMGRNGMGKTTTIRTLTRLLPASGGTIRFAGRDLAGLPAHRAAQLGLGLVPEGRRCFAPLSVAENLAVAARPGAWTLSGVTELFPRLGERLGQNARTLSGGEQQMLAIGRALLTNPRLLILDEATEGLAPLVRQEIWAAVRRLKSGGMSILLVDKSLRELAAVADRAVVLERGRSVWAGAMAALTPEVTDRYLGL
ncbi:ABC transporter ATP-binding protein [Rhodobacter veldkampii DSM 11550]|uniref:ABC transporter ATP-binding protein n=1 Tax=Phaeovulum veldkampii DSM 11550 TaxID=1185920 RepID=A0A2T4JL43_9RHOB|nr:ABC transporter ATP-binding protein [Phaeovulum veldkampii]MBK5947034.1 ABC transporter ATP-binding protein [Phaeovulum veldkampii DSM 11550]PTE18650.1 ABC transporter ATP-binding protein [Phaeovulum veldkampii DSM 11550]TDQ57281.1 amino acid/amide ABC transporter ATP-binding protein 2 (HAAT family) [Phaeovulum veldkampii DSM 11550]